MSKKMKILITGSRSITDKELVFSILDKEIKKDDIIIHGGARGSDSIVKEYCNEKGNCCVVVRPIDPENGIYYLHRNAEMVGMCDRVIAFWDERSRGTKFTIDYAKKRKLEVKVYFTKHVQS